MAANTLVHLISFQWQPKLRYGTLHVERRLPRDQMPALPILSWLVLRATPRHAAGKKELWKEQRTFYSSLDPRSNQVSRTQDSKRPAKPGLTQERCTRRHIAWVLVAKQGDVSHSTWRTSQEQVAARPNSPRPQRPLSVHFCSGTRTLCGIIISVLCRYRDRVLRGSSSRYDCRDGLQQECGRTSSDEDCL